MIDHSKWKWFGDAGHFICGDQCRFHLCTQVGSYLISTVGEYRLEGDAKLASRLRGRDKRGNVEIGIDRTFETMVFKAGKPCRAPGCACGLPEISGCELDFSGYNDAGAATRGHLAMCKKYASKQSPKEKK